MSIFKKGGYFFFILAGLVFIFLTILNMKEYEASRVSEGIVYDYVVATTEQRSSELSGHFEKAAARLKVLKKTILSLVKSGKFDRKLMYDVVLSNLDSADDIRSIWVFLEPNAFDLDHENQSAPGNNLKDRFAPWFYYDDQGLFKQDYCKHDEFSYYTLPKKYERTILTEPYFGFSKAGEKLYFISVTEPILYNGFKGAVGIDWTWDEFNTLITNSAEFENSMSYLVSSEGKVLAHNNLALLDSIINDDILDQVKETLVEKLPIVKQMGVGDSSIYRIVSSFELPFTESSWVLVTEIPKTSNVFGLLNALKENWIFGGVLLFILVLIMLSIARTFFVQQQEKSNVEHQLASTENKISSIMEAGGGMTMYALDQEYRYTNFNDSHYQFMKEIFKSEIAIGESIVPQLPEKIRDYAIGFFDRALRGEYFVHDDKYRGKTYHQIFNPIHNDEGLVTGLTCKIIDVTDIAKAQEELTKYRTNLEEVIRKRTEEIQNQKDFMQAIMDENMNVIFVKDLDGRYIIANKRFLTYTRRSLEEVIGKTVKDLDITEKEKELYGTLDDRLMRGKDPISFEGTTTEPEPYNKQMWFVGRKSYMKIGNEEYILTVMSDITERKGYENSLSEANLELQNTIEKLTNAQLTLVEQEKMATLGQLSAGLAHEINNPLNFISGNVSPLKRDIGDIKLVFEEIDRLKETDNEIISNLLTIVEEIEPTILFPEIDKLLSGIKEGALRVTEVVNNFREFASSDAEAKREYDLNRGIELTTKLLASSLGIQINIIMDLAKDLPLVYCDQSKINKVFLNVISNSIQAIEGTGEVTIKSYGNEKSVFVMITDNGKGMTEEEKMRVFDPFYSTKVVGQGIGMGMTISYGIIESHGGTINVDSAIGKGTTVIIKLPAI